MKASNDWREELRRNVQLAADEIAAHGADAVCNAGAYVTGFEIVVRFDIFDSHPTIEYNIETMPEGCCNIGG